MLRENNENLIIPPLFLKGNCEISKEYNGSLIIPPPLLRRYSPYLKGRARLDISVIKSGECPMESVDRKQRRMHSAWRSPLKIGGVPPLAGRGYDSILSVSFKIGRGYYSFLSVSLKKERGYDKILIVFS